MSERFPSRIAAHYWVHAVRTEEYGGDPNPAMVHMREHGQPGVVFTPLEARRQADSFDNEALRLEAMAKSLRQLAVNLNDAAHFAEGKR